MIKTILKFLVQHEEQTDGGLESLLTIIKHYKGNSSSINLNEAIQNNYPLTSTEELMKTASKCGLLSVVCDNIEISTIINYNQPLIIFSNTAENKILFLVCYSYSKENGFLIFDSRNDFYYASIDGLKSLRANQKCIAFCIN